MNLGEAASLHEEMYDLNLGFDLGEFDINAAFQEALYGVVSDEELALEEKVRRMEVIVQEGTSDIYRDFVDFRQMAAQMQMMCNHDHEMSQSMQGNDTLFGFMDRHTSYDGHNHSDETHNDHSHKEEDDTDSKTGKKKKKRRGWFSILLK